MAGVQRLVREARLSLIGLQPHLRRFIDLFHQGIIDHLLVGKEVETDWEALLGSLLDQPAAPPAPAG